MRKTPWVLLATLTPVFWSGIASAEVAVLTPARDVTLYQDDDGSVANGGGQHLFAGRNASGNRRRPILAFDVAAHLPPGSTVTAVSLDLNVSNVPPVALSFGIGLHRVLTSWGEGASNAPGQEGQGTDAEPGDATWLYRFYPGDFWAEEGGDFAPAASASEVVGGLGPVTWESTPGLVADVQTWLDDPSSDNGWLLFGESFAFQAAKRFDSREHPDPDRRPRLTVEFEPPPVEIPALSLPGLLMLAAILATASLRRMRKGAQNSR